MKKRIFLVCMMIGVMICSAMSGFAQPELVTPSAILMEAQTGKVLYEKQPDIPLPMASITKLMTLYIAMEEMEKGTLSKEDLVVGSKAAKEVGGSTIFLEIGEKMTVDDIIKGICVNSGNDAAVALAEKIAGSESEFAVRMNEKAQELGMTNTNYVNASGMDVEGHHSSARDIAILSRAILNRFPQLLEYTGIWSDTLRGGRTMLANTNRLLKSYQYTTGLKTGTTDNAGYCISATANKDGMQLIAVIMNAPDANTRFEEAQELLEYGYDNFEVYPALKAGEEFGEVPVEKGAKETEKAIVDQDITVVIPKTYSDKIKQEVVLEEKVAAPVEKGTKLGELILKAGDEVVETVELKAAEGTDKITFFQAIGNVIRAWLSFDFK